MNAANERPPQGPKPADQPTEGDRTRPVRVQVAALLAGGREAILSTTVKTTGCASPPTASSS